MPAQGVRVLLFSLFLFSPQASAVKQDRCNTALQLLSRVREATLAAGSKAKVRLSGENIEGLDIETYWSFDLDRRQNLGNAQLVFRDGEVYVEWVSVRPGRTLPIAQLARTLRMAMEGSKIKFVPAHETTTESLEKRLRTYPEWAQVDQKAPHLTPMLVVIALESRLNAELTQHSRDVERRLPLVSLLRRAGFTNTHIRVSPPDLNESRFGFEVSAE